MLFHPTQTLSTHTYIRKGYARTYVSALWIWKCVKHTWNIRSPIQCISALSAPLLHITTREPTLHHSNFCGAIACNSITLVALPTSQELAGHWSHSHAGSAPQWRSSRKYISLLTMHQTMKATFITITQLAKRKMCTMNKAAAGQEIRTYVWCGFQTCASMLLLPAPSPG